MPPQSLDSGDYDDDMVANLLKQDAKTSSQKYSMVGLEAFLHTRPSSRAPKPNTRFLRNILRETDSHNAALLAKEAEESKTRLRDMRRKEANEKTRVGRLTPPRYEGNRGRHRREEDYGRSSKRRRVEDDVDAERDRARRRRHEANSRRERSNSRDRNYRKENRSKRHEPREEDDDRIVRHSRHHRHEKYGHDIDSDPTRVRRKDRGHRRHRSNSRPRTRSRSQSPRHSDRHRRSHHDRYDSPPPRQESTPRDKPSTREEPSKRTRSPSPGSASDPLEAIVGPLPPPPPPKVRSRGRGAFKSASAMDDHFATTYDPIADVQPNSDENDWDEALEALRDRERWKRQGAERLRAAGFADEEVKRWEKGGEKTEEDVRWAKKGEGREWDRGKVVDEDGLVDLQAEWGRLR